MERYDGKTEEQIKKEARLRDSLIFLGVVAVIIVGVLLSRLNSEPELNIVIAFEGAISAESRAIFEEFVTREGISVNVEYLTFDPATDEAGFNALSVKVAVDDYCLFILSDQPKGIVGGWFPGLSTLFCGSEFFDDINDVGPVLRGFEYFEFDEDAKYYSRVQVNETPLFEEMGLGGIEFYASVIDWTEQNGSIESLEAAVQIIHDILNYGQG